MVTFVVRIMFYCEASRESCQVLLRLRSFKENFGWLLLMHFPSVSQKFKLNYLLHNILTK